MHPVLRVTVLCVLDSVPLSPLLHPPHYCPIRPPAPLDFGRALASFPTLPVTVDTQESLPKMHVGISPCSKPEAAPSLRERPPALSTARRPSGLGPAHSLASSPDCPASLPLRSGDAAQHRNASASSCLCAFSELFSGSGMLPPPLSPGAVPAQP